MWQKNAGAGGGGITRRICINEEVFLTSKKFQESQNLQKLG